jgi:dTDP-4-amino-4,6-dideoxygalactose transaminase
VDAGSSFVPAEIAAHFFWRNGINGRDHCSPPRSAPVLPGEPRLLKNVNCSRFPGRPPVARPTIICFVLLADGRARDGLMAHLKQKESVRSFTMCRCIHRRWEAIRSSRGDLPRTEDLSSRLLRLPFYADITPEQNRVVTCVSEFLTGC